MPGFSSTGQTAIPESGVFDQAFGTSRKKKEVAIILSAVPRITLDWHPTGYFP